MKLSRQRDYLTVGKLALPALAVLSIGVGLIAGKIARLEGTPTEAASSNIIVENNDQSVSRDQSTNATTIMQTSTVTVRNLEANYGYTLSAKIGQNMLTGVMVTVGSTSSPECSAADPCALNNTDSTIILATDDDEATLVDGDTTTFTVTITVPADTAINDYILDIEYQEEANPTPTPLTEGANIQDVTEANCNVSPIGTIVSLKDTRDGTYYRVKKMPDGNCWMVDNLAFNLNKIVNPSAPTYSPAAALVSGTTASVSTQAQYAQNNNIAGQGQIPNNGNPKASYLYNWCAALGDTSTNCAANLAAGQYQTIDNSTTPSKTTTGYTATNQPEVQGICPAPFRLPKGGPVANPANDGTNTATALASTANDFVKLAIAMGGTGTAETSASIYPNFTGTTADQKDWFGVLSGRYLSGLSIQGSRGFLWTSTANSTLNVYNLDLTQSTQYVGPANNGDNRIYGFAVRCLL